MSFSRQFCTFYLEKLLFGVELQKVQEVIRYLELTDVPLAPHGASGLMNLRGQIVTAVDLRRRLELPQGTQDTLPMSVVVRAPDGAVSMLVDDIGEVVDVEEESFERLPETLHGKIREVLVGVYNLDKYLMHVLDTDKACEATEQNQTVVGSEYGQHRE
jgi:purine-binding chemotaxis protein CheW